MDTPLHGSARPRTGPRRTTRLLLAAVLSLATTAGMTSVASPPPAAAATAVMRIAPDSYEKKVRYWVNVRRKNKGLRPVRFATCPTRTARRWSRHLASTDQFYHQPMKRVLNRCQARYAGETLALGRIRPRRTVRLWMQSPPHRKILLSRRARRIGIGAKADSHGRWVVTANFVRF